MGVLDVFDGLHQYGVFTIPDLYRPVLEWTAESGAQHDISQSSGRSSLPKIWGAAVHPGYDERLMPKRKGHFQRSR